MVQHFFMTDLAQGTHAGTQTIQISTAARPRSAQLFYKWWRVFEKQKRFFGSCCLAYSFYLRFYAACCRRYTRWLFFVPEGGMLRSLHANCEFGTVGS